VPEQFVGFFGRRLAIVAGYRNLDVIGDEPSFERIDLLEDPVRDRSRVGPRPFGNAEGYRRLFVKT
jgi:hypothetical protein